MRTGFQITVAAAVLAVAAACSSGGNSSDSHPSSSSSASSVAWARCMRQHGVDVPDSAGPNGSFTIRGGTANTAQIQSAMASCRKLRPAGDSSGKKMSTADLVTFAHCMRKHGIDVPDPQPNGNGGYRMALPEGAQSGPAVTRAEQACSPNGSIPFPQGGGKK